MQAQPLRQDAERTHLQSFIRYKAWANRVTFIDLLKLPSEEITKKRATNFGNIISTLNHTYVVDDIFRAHIEGRKHAYTKRNTDTAPALSELWASVQDMDNWYIDRVDEWTDSDLNTVVEFEFVGGGAGRMTRQEIIYHIVNHGTYHRGFVSDMMYQVPARPTANDYPVYLRDVWNASPASETGRQDKDTCNALDT